MATSITNTSISTDTINVDNGVLYVDNVNNRVGVGTDSPTAALEVNRDSSPFTAIFGAPQGSGKALLFKDNHASPNKYNYLIGSQYNINNGFEITPSTAIGGTTFSNPAIAILENGRVGIGTINPQSKLEISDGGIHVTSPTGIQGLIIDTDQSNTAVSGRFVLKNNTSASSVYYSDSLGWTFHTGTILGTTSGTQRMYLTPQGYLRLPYQPSWGARSLSNTTSSGGTSNANEILRFGETINNTGNHYNSSTGVFTCPVAGRYFVTFSGLYDDSYNNTGAVYIRHNGTERYRGYHQNSGGYYEQISMSGVIDAATNDTIDIYSTMAGWHVGGETSWAGFLIG